MKNFNTLMLICFLMGFFQTDVVMGASLVASEIDTGGRQQVNTYSLDLATLINVQVRDTDTKQTFWLNGSEKNNFLYNSDDLSIYLSENEAVEASFQSNYVLKTDKGTARINTNTGIINYVPKADATGNDVFYYKIKCRTCEDDSQKTLTLSFATAQKTGETLPTNIDFEINNYPNPFSAKTVVQYMLNQDGNTSIQLYSATGALVKSIKNNEYLKGVYCNKPPH